MRPKTVECAVKGCYASLYNFRGIQERTFARFRDDAVLSSKSFHHHVDALFRHDTCVMGLAVVAQYESWGVVTSNAVTITRDIYQPGSLINCIYPAAFVFSGRFFIRSHFLFSGRPAR